MAPVVILIALKRNQVFYLSKSCYAVLRACIAMKTVIFFNYS